MTVSDSDKTQTSSNFQIVIYSEGILDTFVCDETIYNVYNPSRYAITSETTVLG